MLTVPSMIRYIPPMIAMIDKIIPIILILILLLFSL